jgi:DNA-binding CsgD family transcriptional regulator
MAHCDAALALFDAGFGHPDHIRTLGLTLIFCERYPQARRVLAAHVVRQRRADNPYFLASGLTDQGELLRRTGNLVAAEVAAQEAYAIATRMRHRYLRPLCATALAHVRVLRGDRGALQLAEQAAAASIEPGNRTLTAPALARARLLAGEPAAALAALAPVIEFEPDGYREPNHSRALALRLEALIAVDQADEAVAVIARVDAAAAPSTRWTRSTLARFRGVLAEDVDTAEAAFAEALAVLAPEDGPIERGLIGLDRARRLRRAGRRREASQVVQSAYVEFAECGAVALAELAAREIGATAPRLRPQTEATNTKLTAREAEIAQLAATGASDRAIATSLYISPRTVDFHLRNVFRKRGVRSRGELAAQMLGESQESSRG